MDPADLIATAALSLSGWLPISSQKPASGAVKAHASLVKLVNTYSSGSNGKAKAAKTLRIKLIEEINGISGDIVKAINSDLVKLRQNPCSYRIEDEEWSGEKIILTIGFDQLPAVGDVEAIFGASTAVRELDPMQQHFLVHAVEAQAELNLTKIHLGFATEDENSQEIEELGNLAKTQGTVVAAALRTLDQPNIDVFKQLCRTLKLLQSKTSLPVAVCESMSDDGLRQVANWFALLGEDIYCPFPIDPDSPSEFITTCEALWTSYEDTGSKLLVLAAWLRSLATENVVYKRCRLCFRHLQEIDLGAGKKQKQEEKPKIVIGRFYCPEHINKVGHRQPKRENYIAQIYLLEVDALFKKSPEFKLLLSDTEFSNLETTAMQKQGDKLEIPLEILKPAFVLASQLRKLLPVLGPELSLEAGNLFEDMLKVAREPFVKSMPNEPEEQAHMIICRRLATRWLGWDSFVSYWFGKGYSPYWKKPDIHNKEWAKPEWSRIDVLGKNNDPCHRAAAKQEFPLLVKSGGAPAKFILDLLYHRAWIQAKEKFDRNCFINIREVTVMKNNGDSFASIGKSIGVSPEAIRKTLINTADPLLPNSEQRVLPNKLKQLISSYSE